MGKLPKFPNFGANPVKIPPKFLGKSRENSQMLRQIWQKSPKNPKSGGKSKENSPKFQGKYSRNSQISGQIHPKFPKIPDCLRNWPKSWEFWEGRKKNSWNLNILGFLGFPRMEQLLKIPKLTQNPGIFEAGKAPNSLKSIFVLDFHEVFPLSTLKFPFFWDSHGFSPFHAGNSHFWGDFHGFFPLLD